MASLDSYAKINFECKVPGREELRAWFFAARRDQLLIQELANYDLAPDAAVNFALQWRDQFRCLCDPIDGQVICELVAPPHHSMACVVNERIARMGKHLGGVGDKKAAIEPVIKLKPRALDAGEMLAEGEHVGPAVAVKRVSLPSFYLEPSNLSRLRGIRMASTLVTTIPPLAVRHARLKWAGLMDRACAAAERVELCLEESLVPDGMGRSIEDTAAAANRLNAAYTERNTCDALLMSAAIRDRAAWPDGAETSDRLLMVSRSYASNEEVCQAINEEEEQRLQARYAEKVGRCSVCLNVLRPWQMHDQHKADCPRRHGDGPGIDFSEEAAVAYRKRQAEQYERAEEQVTISRPDSKHADRVGDAGRFPDSITVNLPIVEFDGSEDRAERTAFMDEVAQQAHDLEMKLFPDTEEARAERARLARLEKPLF